MSTVDGAAKIPSFLGALESARQGIDRGLEAFDAAAQAIASGSAGESAAATAASLVGALTARNQVAAAARVMETGDQLLGTLLNLHA